jgi:hypothetical protein
MQIEIISFFADVDGRTYYSDHAARLRENCLRLKIPFDIRPFVSRGEYRLNCLAKPQFLLSVLNEKQKPLVWLDIDSIVHNELIEFDSLESSADIGFAYPATNSSEIQMMLPKASPIYLAPNPITFEFLEFWVAQCRENESTTGSKFFDHEILILRVLPAYISKMKVAVFGMNYVIFPGTDCPSGMTPMITMGIADGISKEKSLREMGMDEYNIQRNLIGNIPSPIPAV